ncbi:MAG: VCBS repeat-containing protein [Gemmatimonadetes bacterium]|nr:VCBS repeat-containing protein [Gemmatimonadota bacterium]
MASRATRVPLLALGLALACSPPDEPRSSGASGPADAGDSEPLPAALWHDVTDELLDSTGEWTNKVELADLNGDGRLDLLFANGGDYSNPGEPEMNRAFYARPGAPFQEATTRVFGSAPDLTRVIKAADLTGDGVVDVFVGNTYQTPSRLFIGNGSGGFTEETSGRLPSMPLSLGDAEPGDVDGDGDLDLVLADWGPGDNMTNDGGRTRLWLNDGSGRFIDATSERMPDLRVRFSWDLEFVDVDNDLDLDVLVSCKRCAGGFLFRNDGVGTFEMDRRGLPQYTNNYEYEAMDLDGDGFLDLATINDGDIVGGVGSSRREHVFRNDGEGRFRDVTDDWWPDDENPGFDDNLVTYLDYDSDGDADFLVGSLSGPDRLMINDGSGGLTVAPDVFEGEETPGTLGMSIGDVDGDGRIDVIQSQGEHPTAIQERIFSGRGLAPDAQAPVVTLVTVSPRGAAMATTSDAASGAGPVGDLLVRARVHDRKSPMQPTDFESVQVHYGLMDAPTSAPMRWYGEFLWWATVPAEAENVEVCATDAAGNERCEVPGS